MRSNTTMKGDFVTPAASVGTRQASTNTVPMKKNTRRITVVRIAIGMTRSGDSVSPAATPMSSVPKNANVTTVMAASTGAKPLGRSPCSESPEK